MGDMARNYASAETSQTYDEFVNANDPFYLMGEIAASRALIVEARNSLEAGAAAKVETFYRDVQSGFQTMVNLWAYRYPSFPPEIIEEVQQSLLNVVQQSFSYQFPTSSRITMRDAEIMGKLIKNVVDISEKYKKMMDDLTIKLESDGNFDRILMNFVVNVILPNIADQDKMLVGAACVDYFAKGPVERALVPSKVSAS